MKVVFLGTGTSQGIPVIGCNCQVCNSNNVKDKRLRSSVAVISHDTTIVIDTSIDFRQQMLNSNIKKLDAILYTHEHKDHTAGLDDVRSYNFLQKKSMDVYAEDRVFRALVNQFPYIFAERKYPGIPQINTISIKDEEFFIQKMNVCPLRIWHYRLPILGYRINNFAYITDASSIPDEEKAKLKDIKCLVIGAIRKEKHYSHFNLDEALEEINQINPERAFITHIGHFMGLYNEVTKELPEKVELAYDGLEIDV